MAHNVSHDYAGDKSLFSRLAASFNNFFHNHYVLRRVSQYSDFIGLNYYFANRMYGFNMKNPNERINDLGWDMQPHRVSDVMVSIYRQYKMPIIITENGLADMDDLQRKWWIEETMLAMHSAISRGVNLVGYLHWSLLDNFEWDKGYWPRFGLAAVDRTTMRRTVRPSARWFAKQISQLTAKK